MASSPLSTAALLLMPMRSLNILSTKMSTICEYLPSTSYTQLTRSVAIGTIQVKLLTLITLSSLIMMAMRLSVLLHLNLQP